MAKGAARSISQRTRKRRTQASQGRSRVRVSTAFSTFSRFGKGHHAACARTRLACSFAPFVESTRPKGWYLPRAMWSQRQIAFGRRVTVTSGSRIGRTSPETPTRLSLAIPSTYGRFSLRLRDTFWGVFMGPMAAALAEAKLMAERQGSPLLGYLIEMALIQCVDEEAAREQGKQPPNSPLRDMDDRTRATP